MTAKAKMTLHSTTNTVVYAAEIIPVIGGVVTGGSDGMMTVRAGRVAKRVFLRAPEVPQVIVFLCYYFYFILRRFT